VLREIRAAGERFDPELPVLVLSGRSSEADRLRGFEAGADDYLPKPFHYPELLARVAAVLRRRSGARRGPIRLGDLTLDPATRRVTIGDRRVELANKEFALLRALAAEPRRVLLDPEGARYVFNCWGVLQRHLFESIPVPKSGEHGQ
jgi:DNA-binding response OmpR family regulator